MKSEEYQSLVEAVSDPLFQAARKYLNDKELGFIRWQEEPNPLLKEAVLFVSSESFRHDKKMRDLTARNRDN